MAAATAGAMTVAVRAILEPEMAAVPADALVALSCAAAMLADALQALSCAAAVPDASAALRRAAALGRAAAMAEQRCAGRACTTSHPPLDPLRHRRTISR